MLNPLLLISVILLLNYTLFLILVYRGLNHVLKLNKDEADLKINDAIVSVIIPFRNESGNILNSLSCIVRQNYPQSKYEVLYVNDSSSDDSLGKICNAAKPENIKVISVPPHSEQVAFKKRAIDYAINLSRGEIIVLTDCDCVHHSEWLSLMIKEFNQETALVSGPVAFKPIYTVFGKMQQLEFAGLILTGAGLIGINKPVICSSANLAFRKKTYLQVGGYNDNLNLSSGDDELLMQKIASATDYEIKFCSDPRTVVLTRTNTNLQEFYQQRRRWASKGLFYNNKLLVFELILIFLFYLSLPTMFIAGFLLSHVYLVVFPVFIILKIIPEFLILLKGKNFLFQNFNMGIFLLAEICHIPYILISGVAGLFGNFTWKNRKLKR